MSYWSTRLRLKSFDDNNTGKNTSVIEFMQSHIINTVNYIKHICNIFICDHCGKKTLYAIHPIRLCNSCINKII